MNATAAALKIVKPSSAAEKRTHSVLDTVEINHTYLCALQPPPFQRPLRVNDKVRAVADTIKRDGGVLPGVITIGVLANTKYILDGQHRIEAFKISGLKDGYAEVRMLFCETMGEMGEEFVNLNSRIANMRPDDILRGLEGSYPPLRLVREKCRFVGYDMIRKSENAPLVSMSAMLRMWNGSRAEVPSSGGISAQNLGIALTMEDAEQLIAFLNVCLDAWGREFEYFRMWGGLNLILCAWLYRRTVITQYSPRTPRLTRELFKKCLMSLSADANYLDWLLGRQLGERDRSPAYDRVRRIFAKRIESETGTKPGLPSPVWSKS